MELTGLPFHLPRTASCPAVALNKQRAVSRQPHAPSENTSSEEAAVGKQSFAEGTAAGRGLLLWEHSPDLPTGFAEVIRVMVMNSCVA